MSDVRSIAKRCVSHMIRPSGLSAMDILRSKSYLEKTRLFFSLHLHLHDHSHSSLTCITIGLYYLLLYTHRNTQHNFSILLIPDIHNHLQYDIESQYQGIFHLKFGRLSKIQAQRVYVILGLPLTITTDNRFSCSTELVFLIFLM